VASPWTRGGWVNSQLFDHSSTLQFLETFVANKQGQPVREENLSAWRRSISGDLTSVFRPSDPAGTLLDYVKRDPFVVSIAEAQFKPVPSGYRELTAAEIAQSRAKPAGASWMPRQEPGTRPACALPYELYAEGRLSSDGTHFELMLRADDKLHGARSAGAPFNVYLRNLADATKLQAATYAVRAGDTHVCSYPLALFARGGYEIEVHAPNGFYRHFHAGAEPQPIVLEVGYELQHEAATGNLRLLLHNVAATSVAVEIADNAYGGKPVRRTLRPGRPEVVLLASSGNRGWYDYSLRTPRHGETRFAGRVETGRPSITDPVMGGASS
jgi:phospholipase C